ncbi:MAG: hypothetical protein ABIH26_08360 [Candidatus Eisenbacteria bacterium]
MIGRRIAAEVTELPTTAGPLGGPLTVPGQFAERTLTRARFERSWVENFEQEGTMTEKPTLTGVQLENAVRNLARRQNEIVGLLTLLETMHFKPTTQEEMTKLSAGVKKIRNMPVFT